MLIKIHENRIVSSVSISSKLKENEFLQANPNYIKTDFIFTEDLDLYEYDPLNDTFNLVASWEVIKEERERQRLAEIEASQPSFEELKLLKIKILHSKFDAIYQEKLKKYSQIEQSTFVSQEEDYRAYIKDNTVATPTIDTISSSRGITKEELITRIGNNLNERDTNVGQLQAAETLIKNTTTPEELEVVCTQLKI